MTDQALDVAEEDCAADRQDGYAAGRGWALEDARPRELRKLEREQARYDQAHLDPTRLGNEAESIGDRLFNVLSPKGLDAEEFWREALGDEDANRIDDPEFAQAFILGALTVWNRVKKEVP
jgi:hypothetical protein